MSKPTFEATPVEELNAVPDTVRFLAVRESVRRTTHALLSMRVDGNGRVLEADEPDTVIDIAGLIARQKPPTTEDAA